MPNDRIPGQHHDARPYEDDGQAERLPRPLVRLVDSLTCPVCGRFQRHVTLRAGIAWLDCNVRDLTTRGACHTQWLDLTLPPGAIGQLVVTLVGADEARALLTVAIPGARDFPDERLWALRLVPAGAERPGHLQLVVDAPLVHRVRWQPIAAVLRALSLL